MSNNLKNINVFEVPSLKIELSGRFSIVKDCLSTIAIANLQTQQHTALNANQKGTIYRCACGRSSAERPNTTFLFLFSDNTVIVT